MITCRELAEILFDLTSGQLSSEHQGHVEGHLRRCPSCVAYLESYRLTVEMARQLPRPPLPPRLTQQLRALLEEGSNTQDQSATGRGGTPPSSRGRDSARGHGKGPCS